MKELVAARLQATVESGVRSASWRRLLRGSYVIEFCDKPRAKDKVLEQEGARVYGDPNSLLYLNGTTLDYADTFQQKGFQFLNPQQRSECGCGQSFSI
jgi:iron-sulfur cluster assembly protein